MCLCMPVGFDCMTDLNNCVVCDGVQASDSMLGIGAVGDLGSVVEAGVEATLGDSFCRLADLGAIFRRLLSCVNYYGCN